MPHTNTWKSESLYRKFTGIIDSYEILESNLKLQEHPYFATIKYIINDFTEVTGHSIQNGHIDVFAETDEIAAYTKSELKIAILVTQPELLGLAENYREEMKSKTFECEIFPTIEDARQWVDK